jgi:hypothetical protein
MDDARRLVNTHIDAAYLGLNCGDRAAYHDGAG